MTERQANREASTQAWREAAENAAIKRDIRALRAARAAKRNAPTISDLLRGPSTQRRGFFGFFA